jgi:hypothetical protein
MDKLPMRDERALPIDRDESSAPQADGASADLRTDMPAPLSAVSHPADAEDPGMSDEEIAMYRRRVADGMYNTREVADEVARRMLRRGDI